MESERTDSSDINNVTPSSSAVSSNYIHIRSETEQLSNTLPSLSNSPDPIAELSGLKIAINERIVKINNTEQHSEVHKWHVRYLDALQSKVQQLEDPYVYISSVVSTFGHRFKPRTVENVTVCDHCCCIIWIILEKSCICEDCKYVCHYNCVNKVRRVCVRVIAAQENGLLTNICPDIGLPSQEYKCIECEAHLNPEIEGMEPRLCNYFGLYFCGKCHWNNTIEIPARIAHNWDWEPKHVSRSAYQLLSLTKQTQFINLDTLNETTIGFTIGLGIIRFIRDRLKLSRKYLWECPFGCVIVTYEMSVVSETPHLYSMEILKMIKDDRLETKLMNLREKCWNHIKNCQVCRGKTFLCQLCNIHQPIFPFDLLVISCVKCDSYFHRTCWMVSPGTCAKCIRVEYYTRSVTSTPMTY